MGHIRSPLETMKILDKEFWLKLANKRLLILIALWILILYKSPVVEKYERRKLPGKTNPVSS